MPPRRNQKKAKDANARDAPPSILDVWGKFFTIPPVEVFQEPVNEWALDTLQQIREYRDELKDQLEECVAKKMKKTPKKLAFKMPAIPKPTGRRIDFGAEEEVGTAPPPATPAAPTPPAAPAPPAAVTPRSAPRTIARTPTVVANKSVDETMRPFHTSKRVIPATPSPRHLQASSPAVNRAPLAAPSMGTASTPTARPTLTPGASAGRTFTTKPREAKSPARNADRLEAKRKEEEERRLMLEEAQRKQQEAERRRQEYLQHEKERHARENNQRKQRVVLRNKAKQQQDEQQREEKKRQEDRIRKFHEAQRTPNKQTPTKVLHAAHPPVTPRQKAIPIKRSKPSHDEPVPEVEHQHVEEEQEESVEEMQVEEFNPPSSIHPPSPPAAGPSHEPPAVEVELEVQTVVTVVAEFESAMNISGPTDQPLTQGYSVAEADNEESREAPVEQPPAAEADRTKVVTTPRVPPTRVLEESKDEESEDSTAMEAEAVEQSTQPSKDATPNETAAKPPPAESVVLEESPFDEEDEKENAQAAVPETPVAAPRSKPNESVYEMTPDKIYLPSTEHDYNVRDLTSGDETDDEENPRKRVPKWAEKNHLGPHVRDLLRRIDDPSLFFGQIKPPKMDLLFPATVQKYQELPNETTVWDSPISQPRRAPLKK